jgi:uncharacterized protein with GYD domain
MVRYMTLISFTQSGIADVEHSPHRADEFRKSVEAAGGRVVDQYWIVGEVDGAVIFEAPDESTASSLLLKLARQGFTRTRSMRAYDAQEFKAVLDQS